MFNIITLIILFTSFIFICYLLKKNNKKQKVKLVIRLPNWIGDTLMVYPTLLALQQSKIDFICIGHPWTNQLFSGTNFKIISSSKIKNMYWYYKNIYKKYDFEYGIIFTKSLPIHLLMKLSNIKIFSYNYFSHIKVPYKEHKHRTENYYDLANYFINKNIKLNKLNTIITINKEYIKKATKIVNKFNLFDKQFIVICPYAKNLHKGKNKEWPYWKQFCDSFKKYKIVALVSNKDLKKCKKDYPNIITISKGLIGNAYIMTKAKYVLTNDSGAMHLASFFGANIIGIFGITEIHKTKPWHGKYIIGENNSFPDLQYVINKIN